MLPAGISVSGVTATAQPRSRHVSKATLALRPNGGAPTEVRERPWHRPWYALLPTWFLANWIAVPRSRIGIAPVVLGRIGGVVVGGRRAVLDDVEVGVVRVLSHGSPSRRFPSQPLRGHFA